MFKILILLLDYNYINWLSDLNLSSFLIFVAIPFVLSAVFFGTKNGYYNSDDYEGDGCAHDVQRWRFFHPVFNYT